MSGLGSTWFVRFLNRVRGLTTKAPRRGVHRRKRERRPLPGMMLFQDGSKHAWLGQSTSWPRACGR